MDKINNNNVLSMRDYLEAKNKQETYYCGKGPGRVPMEIATRVMNIIRQDRKSVKDDNYPGTVINIEAIEDAISYEYQATEQVLVTFESKDHLFKMLKRVGLAELLRVKYCNLDNPVIKEFFEHIKKED